MANAKRTWRRVLDDAAAFLQMRSDLVELSKRIWLLAVTLTELPRPRPALSRWSAAVKSSAAEPGKRDATFRAEGDTMPQAVANLLKLVEAAEAEHLEDA